MPTAEDRDNAIEQEQEAAPAPAPAPAPAAPDYGALGREIVSGLREYDAERQAAARRAAAPVVQEEQELPINEDDSPAVIAQKAAHNAGIPLRRQLAAMQNQFQTVGLGTLSQVAKRAVLDNDPDYQRYKAEIDAQIATLDPAAQANPDVLTTVRDVVAARHYKDRVADEVQRQVQAALKAGEGAAPGSSSGRNFGSKKSDVPSPEELGFDEDQLNMIQRRGGPDRFAQYVSQGRYANWDDYAKAYQKLNSARKSNTSGVRGAVMSFARAGKK